MRFSEFISELFKDLFASEGGIDGDAVVLFSEGGNNRDGLVLISRDAFIDGIRVVVGPTAGLSPLGHPCHQGFSGAVEVNKIADHHLVGEPFLELIPVLLVAGESVKEVSAISVSGNAVLEQVDHQ
jgi:hypothetical protein